MIKDGATWRPPAVNETCCIRPHLADTLQKIAAGGPDVLYTGQAGQVAPDPVWCTVHMQRLLSLIACFAFDHVLIGEDSVLCFFGEFFCFQSCIV